MNSVEVDIRLTVQDLFLVRLLQFTRKPLIVGLIAAVMLVLLGIFIWSIASRSDPNYIAFAEFCLIGMLVPVMLLVSTRRYYRSAKQVQEPMHYTITSFSIAVRSASFVSELELARAWKIQETREYFLIWESQVAAHVLPKRSFRNSEELSHVRALLGLDRARSNAHATV